MRKVSLILVVLLGLLGLVPGVFAQDYEEISYGESLEGEIVDAENDVLYYVFEGTAGDYIEISVESDDTDPVAYLLDAEGELITENDDISPNNYNSYIEYTLEADGAYAIAVQAYAEGSFEITLSGESAAAAEPTSEVFNGSIDDENPYSGVTYTFAAGQNVVIAVTATSGDLDTYLYLLDPDENFLAENDDASRSDTNSALEYSIPADGDYIIVVSRYGFEEGQTSGDFELSITVGGHIGAGGNANSPAVSFDEVAPSGTPNDVAEWTILAFMAGDNNLESSAIIDVNEFELAGGSDEKVRVVVFLDRSGEYDTSNGNWDTARVYEMSGDSGSADPDDQYMPLIDTVDLFDLGGVNSGSGATLTDFLLWGVQNYPAQNYVVSINDHGGGWTGLASDDTEGGGSVITSFEYAEAFKAATEAAGMGRFALLINDACLMSSIEYLDVIAPYFDYTLGASESMYGPGYDMTLLTLGLRQDIPLEQLGTQMIDFYMQTMTEFGLVADQTPIMINLNQYPAVSEAIENFSEVYNGSPSRYARTLGEARYNTYNYAADSWLSFLIDAGDLMTQVQRLSDDAPLNDAAQQVLDAMDSATVYGQRGSNVPQTATLYNINFPLTANEYISDYVNSTTLMNWNNLLSNFYNSFNVSSRSLQPPPSSSAPEIPVLPPSEEVVPSSTVPQVAITNVYPADVVSVNEQAIVSMEVVGRNIARGTFTVDQVQPDGTVQRVDTSDIVTFVELEDGTFDYINLWDEGVNDFDFTWTPTLTTVSDGTNSNIELVVNRDAQSVISGRYRDNPSANWTEVTVTFDDTGFATRGISTGANGQGLAASIRLREGGEFLSYNAVVSPDGRLVYQDGNLYTLSAQGLELGTVNAPSGDYQLGFLIETLGGVTGFNSAAVTVDNDSANLALLGYTTLTEGFSVQYPADWSSMEYFSERGFYSTNDADVVNNFYVYPIYDAVDAASAIELYADLFAATIESEPTAITVDGYDALEFTFSSEVEGVVYMGKAFAVFKPDTNTGLIFSAERTDGGDPSEIYQILLDNVSLFDAAAIQEAGRGDWDWDTYTEETYFPIPSAWMPGEENDFGWIYTVPDVDGAFASAVVYTESGMDARSMLQELLTVYAEPEAGFTLDKVETYYGANHTWEVGYYTADGVVGRMYVTVENDSQYGLWFEAPTEAAEALFGGYFEPILDGFKISVIE